MDDFVPSNTDSWTQEEQKDLIAFFMVLYEIDKQLNDLSKDI